MAADPIVGPYIAHEHLRQRQRELRAGYISEVGDSLSRGMFAFAEIMRAKSEQKANDLSLIGEVYGWDKLPQRAVDEWGKAIEGRHGGRPLLPRDPEGHIVPPAPTAAQLESRRYSALPEADKERIFKIHQGLELPEKELELLDYKRHHDDRMFEIADKRNAILASRGAKGKEGDMPSGWTIENGKPLRVVAGDPRGMTQRQFNNAMRAQGFDEKSLAMEERQIKIETTTASMKAGGTQGKMLERILAAATRSKDPRTITAAWENLRVWNQAHGMPDMGPAPQPRTAVEMIKEILGVKPSPPPSGARPKKEEPKVDIEALETKRNEAVARGDLEEATRLEEAASTARSTASMGAPPAPRTVKTSSGRTILVEP